MRIGTAKPRKNTLKINTKNEKIFPFNKVYLHHRLTIYFGLGGTIIDVV
jgi:hypothetical protein